MATKSSALLGVRAVPTEVRCADDGTLTIVQVFRAAPNDVTWVAGLADLAAANVAHVQGIHGRELATDFVDGETLGALRARWKDLPLEVELRILLDTLMGLDALHNVGFVHGELLPNNIVIGSDGRGHIIQLAGLTRLPREVHPAALGYAAPEQLLRDSPGPSVDLFAVGVMLWEAVARTKLFTETTAMAVVARHVSGQIPTPECAPWAERLIGLAKRVMSTDLAWRPTSAMELLVEIDRATGSHIATSSRVAQLFEDLGLGAVVDARRVRLGSQPRAVPAHGKQSSAKRAFPRPGTPGAASHAAGVAIATAAVSNKVEVNAVEAVPPVFATSAVVIAEPLVPPVVSAAMSDSGSHPAPSSDTPKNIVSKDETVVPAIVSTPLIPLTPEVRATPNVIPSPQITPPAPAFQPFDSDLLAADDLETAEPSTDGSGGPHIVALAEEGADRRKRRTRGLVWVGVLVGLLGGVLLLVTRLGNSPRTNSANTEEDSISRKGSKTGAAEKGAEKNVDKAAEKSPAKETSAAKSDSEKSLEKPGTDKPAKPVEPPVEKVGSADKAAPAEKPSDPKPDTRPASPPISTVASGSATTADDKPKPIKPKPGGPAYDPLGI